MSSPNRVTVSQVSDVVTVELTTAGPQGPAAAGPCGPAVVSSTVTTSET